MTTLFLLAVLGLLTVLVSAGAFVNEYRKE